MGVRLATAFLIGAAFTAPATAAEKYVWHGWKMTAADYAIVPLQDVLHTFEPGHRVMIQVQSTWFPLMDRNPQAWVDSIYAASEADFAVAEHRVYRDAKNASVIEFGVLPPSPGTDEAQPRECVQPGPQ